MRFLCGAKQTAGEIFLFGTKCCVLGGLGNPSLPRPPNKKIGSAALPSPINFAF